MLMWGLWKTNRKQHNICGPLQQHKHAVHRNKSLNLIEKVGRIEISLIPLFSAGAAAVCPLTHTQ